MLKLIFNSRWYVALVFAILSFALAGFIVVNDQQHEAANALALQQGVPPAVSLSAFDPEKDIHPADEVTLTAWFNPDYNYQLTETSGKRSDVVRRMFVLFGPEDTPDTKTARAVVLMYEGDVDRFIDDVFANVSGQVAGNPVFKLNGTAKTYATLDNMADDALAEKGLTKAPGFRYVEMWPRGDRAAALAPAPEVVYFIAGPVAGFGLILLIVAGVKFRRRHQFATAVAEIAEAPPAKPKYRLPDSLTAPHTWGFFGFAILCGVAGSWLGSWKLTTLAIVLLLVHFGARIKKAMDRGVTTVATALNSMQTPSPETVSANFAAFASAPGKVTLRPDESPVAQTSAIQPAVQSVPSMSARLSALNSGGKAGRFAGALVVLCAVYLVSGQMQLGGMPTMPGFVTSAPDPQDPAAPAAKAESAALSSAPATAPAAAEVVGAELAPAMPAPVEQAAAEIPALVASDSITPDHPLIPEAASLRPAAPDIADVAASDAAASVPVVEVAAEPAAEPAPAVAADAPPATTTEDPSEPQAGFFATFSVAGFGGLALLAPIAGAILLAVCSLALLRGRQAEAPQKAFAGRDPWEKLARDARGAA